MIAFDASNTLDGTGEMPEYEEFIETVPTTTRHSSLAISVVLGITLYILEINSREDGLRETRHALCRQCLCLTRHSRTPGCLPPR